MFSFTGGGVPWQKFFFQSEHVSSQIWCQKFFPLLRPGTPPPGPGLGTPLPGPGLGTPLQGPGLGTSLPRPELGTPLYPDLDLGPPYPDLNLGPPLPRPGLGTLPTQTWTWTSPPKSEQTDISKYKYYLPSYYVRGR